MALDEERRTKGSLLLGYTKFIKKKWGDNAVEQLNADILFDTGKIQKGKWYPCKVLDDLLLWLAENKGLESCRAAGSSVVTEMGIVTYAIKIIGLKRIIEKGIPETRKNVTFGEVEVQSDDNRAVITLRDMNKYKAGCYAWRGLLEGLYTITGTKGTVEETKCEHDGGSCCVFEMKW